MRILAIIAAAIPFAFGALRAIQTGDDYRYLITALASLVAATLIFRVGGRRRGAASSPWGFALIVLVGTTVITAGVAFLTGARNLPAIGIVAISFSLCTTASQALGLFARSDASSREGSTRRTLVPSARSRAQRMGELPRVLFVCVENSNRSQMAEAFARIHGAGVVEAYSAGSRPSGKVNERAIAAMRDRGYDLTKHTSRGLDAIPAGSFAAVVTMGCGDACPWVPATLREDWALPDPREMAPAEFNAVRDDIERRVLALLSTLRPR